MTPAVRFPIRYGAFRHLLIAMGAGPRRSGVTIDGHRLTVRMGWMFRGELRLASITSVGPDHQVVGGIGAHGWRGNWLINGAASGIVRVEADPPGRARCMGMPVKLRVLRVSVESPEELQAALSGSRR